MTIPDQAAKLTLHCGLPKTGSTFLQREVFPRASGGRYVSAKLPLRHLLDALPPVSGENAPVLLSDETFTWTPLENAAEDNARRHRRLEHLAGMWPGSQLLLLLREPSEMVRAHYAQYLHHGGFRHFEGFLEHHFHPDSFRFDLLLDRIGAMPWQRTLFIDYQDLRDQPQRTIALLESFTGLRFPGWDTAGSVPRRNVSVSGYGARLLRLSNAYFIRGYPAHGIGLPRKVLRRRRLVNRAIHHGPLRFLNRWGPDLVPDAALQQLRRDLEPSWTAARRQIAASQASLQH